MNNLKKKITIDKTAGAAYIYLKDIKKGDINNSIPLNSNMILDFDLNGVLLGIEILSLDILDLDLIEDEFDVVYL